MTTPLAADVETFIANLIAEGYFATREVVLETAVRWMEAQIVETPLVPPEHMELVEAGFDSLEKYGAVELTPENFEQIKVRVLERAAAERERARAAS